MNLIMTMRKTVISHILSNKSYDHYDDDFWYNSITSTLYLNKNNLKHQKGFNAARIYYFRMLSNGTFVPLMYVRIYP